MRRQAMPITDSERQDAARKIARGEGERTERLARTALIDVVVGGVRAARAVPRRQGAK